MFKLITYKSNKRNSTPPPICHTNSIFSPRPFQNPKNTPSSPIHVIDIIPVFFAYLCPKKNAT